MLTHLRSLLFPMHKKTVGTKRLICFSLWGDMPKYVVGAIENVKLQKQYYPDWTCRFYLDDSVSQSIIEVLKSFGSELIFKPPSSGFTGLYWRFEAAIDDTVERFIVRDCDSRLNQREADAVKEWVDSGLPFHIMRDHFYHDLPILGGMWGARSFFIPAFKKQLRKWTRKLKPGGHKRGAFFMGDQFFLSKIIWPKIKGCHLAHDDKKTFTGMEHPFPTRLKEGYFVGQQFDEHNNPVLV